MLSTQAIGNLQQKSSLDRWIYSIQKDKKLILLSDMKSPKQEMDHLYWIFRQLEQMPVLLRTSRAYLKMKAAKPKSEILTCARRPKMFRKSLSQSWMRWFREEMAILDHRLCQESMIFSMATTCQDLRENINRPPRDSSSTKTQHGPTRNVSTTTFVKVSILKLTVSRPARPTLLRPKAVSYHMT